MTKDKYHHGSLKEDLIEKGLQLLNKEGFEAFSLRKAAAMCGVSHAAPYRHFKSKEDLIYAITMNTSDDFISAIEESLARNSGDYKTQIIELGKQYVKFMVENPEHFKFIFLTNHNNPIQIKNNVFTQEDRWPIFIFKKLLTSYHKSINSDTGDWSTGAITLWSLVHGLSVMLIHNTISYEGDYLELVSRMLTEKINLLA
jgi:AcrR family transcriptional regulator